MTRRGMSAPWLPMRKSLLSTTQKQFWRVWPAHIPKTSLGSLGTLHHFFERLDQSPISDAQLPNLEAKYRALVEQLPAVVFMAYLDRGVGEAYVSPQIEATLGFSQAEWLEDPVKWYQQIHPDDKDRWSVEAAEMFLSGKPLRSAYRVIARNGQVIWFHCEAKMIRRPDGRPWFIHGIAFDITDLKRTEEELQEERNVVSAILDTVGALVIVLDREGRIVRFNRACEQMTGESFATTREGSLSGICLWSPRLVPESPHQIEENKDGFQSVFQQICEKQFVTTSRVPNTRARGWPRRQPSDHRVVGRGPARCQANADIHHRVGNRRHRSRSGRRPDFADCWKRRRMRWWSSIRKGKSFW